MSAWRKNHKKFMKNIFSSIKLPDEDFYISRQPRGRKEFMLIKKRELKNGRETFSVCLFVVVRQIRAREKIMNPTQRQTIISMCLDGNFLNSVEMSFNRWLGCIKAANTKSNNMGKTVGEFLIQSRKFWRRK